MSLRFYPDGDLKVSITTEGTNVPDFLGGSGHPHTSDMSARGAIAHAECLLNPWMAVTLNDEEANIYSVEGKLPPRKLIPNRHGWNLTIKA